MSDPFAAMITGLRALERRSVAAISEGLEAGAAQMEADAKATDAYYGQSGATRESTVAYVTPGGGVLEAGAAYARAAALLDGFTGHEGKAELEDVAGPGKGEAWIVLTVPTDYIINLEQESAGQRAFLADTLHQDAGAALDAVTAALRKVWGG
jgi:hypothetical protein